jgi:hypothetical protein
MKYIIQVIIKQNIGLLGHDLWIQVKFIVSRFADRKHKASFRLHKWLFPVSAPHRQSTYVEQLSVVVNHNLNKCVNHGESGD